MESTVPTARESALRFTEGVRAGWLTSDLVTWIDEHLVRPRRLVAKGDRIREVHEHDFGSVVLQPVSSRCARCFTASHVPRLLEAAREHVVRALRACIDSAQPSFANAALYAGRVVRDKAAGGRSVWRVSLTEDAALSDQVLALFAADLLEHPLDYEFELSVCDACGVVSLSSPSGASRHGCLTHPFGAARPQRVVGMGLSRDRL